MSDGKRKFVKRLNNGWAAYVSAKYPDKLFYYNVVTGETTWEPPDSAEYVQIKQEEESDDSNTGPDCNTLKVGFTSANPVTKSPVDNPHDVRSNKMMNEGRALISGVVVKEEPKGQGKSELQETGRIKLKRRWAESEDSSASCDEINTVKRNVVTRSCVPSPEKNAHEFKASADRERHIFAEKSDNTRKTIPVAGIAELRMIRLRKALEKQKNLSPRKSSIISATTVPEKRSPRSANTSVSVTKPVSPAQSVTTKQSERVLPNRGSSRATSTSVSDRKPVSPTESITTKQTQRFSPNRGSYVGVNIGISDRSRTSPTWSTASKGRKRGARPKKNIAAKRLKDLQDQLKREQKKALQENPNKNVESKTPICVVVHDSHRISDEAEFLEAEEKMLMDVQELREDIHKAGGVNPKEIEEMICEIIPSSFPDTKSNLYIVVDTNVLVSNYQSIDRLCNTNVEGIGCPVFIIPWMVLHELDILKDRRDATKSKMTAVRAQKAINFLHKCFSTKHPRVIGQTVSDAGPEALTGLCNPDNSILHCCLQQVSLGHRVLLLSDDKNLQNKCMVNGIDAVGKSGLMSYLNTLSKQNKSEPETAKTISSTSGESAFDEPASKVNILITNLMHCAKEVLSKIILQEMESAYGDKWLDIICVKPPFSFDDIFTCLMRHWVAVFGLVMSKNSLATVKELKNLYKSHSGNDRGSRISVEEVKNVAIRFARILSEFVKPLYSKLIKEAQTYLENLISDCENPFSRSELKNSVMFSEPAKDWAVSKHLVVVEDIRKICLALLQLCQQLRMVIARDESSVEIRQQAVLSEDDLKTWLSYFYGPVSNLYLIMESVTSAKEAQAMHSPEMVPVMDHMYKDFSELYKLISSGEEMAFSIQDMFSFFEDTETSDIFKEIKEQFHNCGVIMRQAIDHFSEKDLIPFSSNNSANNNTSPDDVEMEEQF